MKQHQRILALSLMTAACGLEGRGSNTIISGGFGTDSADDGGIILTSGLDPATDSLDESGAEEPGADGGSRFDVGSGDSHNPDASSSTCTKVDVVLAVDNSSSMSQEHEALHGPVFDSFPQALLGVGNGLDDFRLAVIDACNDPPAFHNWGDQGDCEFSTGLNYMVSTSPQLEQEYRCVTEFPGGVGPIFPPPPDTNQHGGYDGQPDHCTGSSDDEQPANTASLALSASALADYNADFLRDDAVLFVVAITDEDETPIPAASAQQIADRLIAAKGSIQNVVMLGIGGIGVPEQGDDDDDDDESECDGPYGSAKDANLLREVTAIFEAESRGLYWDLCQGDLEQAFAAAIELIDGACVEFEPVG